MLSTVVPPLACVNGSSSHNIIKLKIILKNSNKVETAKLSNLTFFLPNFSNEIEWFENLCDNNIQQKFNVYCVMCSVTIWQLRQEMRVTAPQCSVDTVYSGHASHVPLAHLPTTDKSP